MNDQVRPSDSIEDRRQKPWVLVEKDLLRDPTITPQCKALYSLLISYGPQRIFPGQQTLADCLGTTRQTISRWLKELKERGLIGWEQRDGTSNKYYILGYEHILPVTPALHPCNTSVTPPVTPALHDQDLLILNQEQETADAGFWGPEGKPEPGQDPITDPLPETDDPISLAAECAKRSKGKKSYTVPPTAGGADPYEDKPLRGFCALVAVDPEQLPPKKRKTWTHQLAKIGRECESTPDEVYQAIRALPHSDDYGWIRPTSPYAKNFQEAIAVLILQGANGGTGATTSASFVKPPGWDKDELPDWLDTPLPDQPHITRADIAAAVARKNRENAEKFGLEIA